jgi:NTE family protein
MLPGSSSGAEPVAGAQPDRDGPRPKICLVLSGGGARGAAHMELLKVPEELLVPIHCIAGTSMGALIGGAYATGMGIPEMDEITRAITSELLLNEKPPRQEFPCAASVTTTISTSDRTSVQGRRAGVRQGPGERRRLVIW